MIDASMEQFPTCNSVCLAGCRRPRRFGNQARAALTGQVRPEPLRLDAKPVLQLRQRKHVQRGPDQPGQEAASAQPTGLEDRKILADHRHVTFVPVPEGAAMLASSDVAAIQMTHNSPLL